MKFPIFTLTIIFIHTLLGGAQAQQYYLGDPAVACYGNGSDAAAGTYLGYDCNGAISCKTSLAIRSQYPYNTLMAMGALLSVDTIDIAHANPDYSTKTDEVIEWNKLVYVPITCSCDHNHQYYFKFITHTVGPDDDTYFHMANNTFQGLATCQAIQVVNDLNPCDDLLVGASIAIPLRCACPTTSQITTGIISVLSYVVGEGDTVSSISMELEVDSESMREANRLSEDTVIYPFTTLLIPVMDNPSTSQTAAGAGTTLSNAEIRNIIIIIGVVVSTVFGAGATTYAVKYRRNGNTNCCSNNNLTCMISKVENGDLSISSNNGRVRNLLLVVNRPG